jgi:inosine-uridine nucleoside N-ribohydrolase
VTIPVLIDTDPGIDDALALLLAFHSPEWRVVALTIVAGNVPVDVGGRNAARVLAAANPTDPPRIALGPPGPRVGPLVTASHIHGDDGLGGLSALRDADGCPRFPEAAVAHHPGDAADLLVECARRWPDELVVVALGPLTNVAAAVDRDREALRRVRAVVAMGGSVAAGGNATAAAEFNIFVDPEAAACVLAAGLPLVLVPLDVTQQVVWPAERIARLAGGPDRLSRFAHAVAERGLALARAAGEAGIVMHDPLAVGVALDASLVESAPLSVAVETAGTLTRGMTVVDRRPPAPGRRVEPNCRVVLRVEAARFLALYEARVCGESA